MLPIAAIVKGSLCKCLEQQQPRHIRSLSLPLHIIRVLDIADQSCAEQSPWRIRNSFRIGHRTMRRLSEYNER